MTATGLVVGTTMRVLLVEDEPDVRTYIEANLRLARNCTFEVTSTTTLALGSEAWAAEPFDAVLLDLGLPDGGDPLEVVRTAAAWDPEPCLVVLTGHASSELALSALREGANDFVTKSTITAPMLERLLSYAVERHHRRRRQQVEQSALSSQVDNLQAYVSSVSHDLKSPLASASMILQFLRDRHADLTPEQLADFIAKADDSITRGVQFAEDLLEDARLGGEGRKPLDLPDLAAEAVVVAAVPDDRKVRIGPFPEGVWGRPPSIQQILVNLLANAGRHSKPGDPSVHVHGEDLGTTVQLIVDDNGDGVPPDQRTSIFEAGASTSDDRTGLGLSTVVRQAATHGGRVWVEDSPTLGGARFVVSLPMRSRSAS